MTEQLQLDFSQSTTQRARTAEKQRDQLTLFASWAPNIDISLHSPTEAVAHIAGKETDRGADWIRGLVGGGRALNRRRVAFPITRLDKLAWVRPPARITLDAATHAIACALHAHALGYKPLKIHKVGRRVAASNPRGWPAGLRVTDAPWTAVEALLNTDLPLTIEKEAEEAVAKRLEKSGSELAKATLSGNSILLQTGRPTLLEGRELPALSYVGEFGDGTYRMPLLLGDALLKDKTIKVDPKAEAAIKRATKPAKPLIIEDEAFPWNLWDFQQDDAGTGIRALKATGGVLFAGGMGSGKVLASSTNVATPTGLRPIGDLVPGDEVLAPSGRPTRVRGVYPHTDWDFYRITFSDGTSALAGEEHRWWVQTPSQKHKDHPGKFMTTGEMLAAGLKQKSGNRKFYIPMTEPLQFEKRDLPVPPYTLGALLGDGSLSAEGDVSLADDDGDVLREVLKELSGDQSFANVTFREFKRNGKTNTWRVPTRGTELTNRLRELGLLGCRSWEKFVPEDYLYSSAGDRLDLLQGLLDTDGGTSGHTADGNRATFTGNIEFCSTSEDLVDAVIWLVQSLGGRASKSASVRKQYTMPDGSKRRGRPTWRVGVSLPPTIDPFRIAVKADKYTPRTKYLPTRGVESIEYWGKSDGACIEVEDPSHQFVIDGAVVTGNTTVSLGVLHEMNLWPALVVLPLSAASTWARQCKEMGKSYYMATGTPAKDWQAIQEGEYDAYIVSFDRLATFSDLLRTKDLKVIVADELQRAKNAGSRRSRALRALASSVPYRIGLSGTPLVGGLSDLLAQCSFLVPTEFPPRASKKTLEDRYPGDPVQSITDHVHSIMVRRKISEVGRPLPPREDRRVNILLTPEQRKALADLEAEAQAAKDAGEFDGSNAKMNALVKLQKMRQTIASPKSAGIGGPNPKLNAGLKVTKQFVEEEGRQGVVFVADRQSFVDMGEMLDKAGITWAGIWGSSSTEDRIESERKLHDGEVKVVLGTVQAAAESWSATPEGTFAVFCSYTYTATQLEQAEARVHRLNSDLNGPNIQIVYIHATDPAVEQSPDDRVVEILTMKRELAAQVIDRDTFEDSTLVSNSMSDLMFMLTGEKDESLELSEKDQKRSADETRQRKEHARATLYKNKGSNKSDPGLVRDDGSTTTVHG